MNQDHPFFDHNAWFIFNAEAVGMSTHDPNGSPQAVEDIALELGRRFQDPQGAESKYTRAAFISALYIVAEAFAKEAEHTMGKATFATGLLPCKIQAKLMEMSSIAEAFAE